MRATTPDVADARAFRVALAIVAAITFVRCAVLVISPLNLYPDEAQYWWWAQTPDFGYFSKPPMVAWVVLLSTSVFGEAEWAIRIASPLLHGATALLLFFIARRMMNGWWAAIAAIAYVTLPGISWSSGLISTDVPLLFFWAAALYAFLQSCDQRGWSWPVVCGIALGLGLLSKYAMLFFLPGAAIAALWSPLSRRYVFSLRGLATLVVAAMIFSPNAFWNASHAFPTVAHTATNAHWGRSHFSFAALGLFALGQFGVFGPILMAGWIAALWRLTRRGDGSETMRIMAAFSVPPMLIILVQAFVAGANANWAATAYVAATPLAVGELAGWWKARPLQLTFVINGAVVAMLLILLARPDIAEPLGLGNAFKREEGWRQFGAEVSSASRSAPYDAVVADNRSIAAELLYYGRAPRAPMRVWSRDLNIRDHFEMTMRLAAGARRVLLVLEPSSAARVLATFDSAVPLKTLTIPVGGHHRRVAVLYDARHYRGPQLRS